MNNMSTKLAELIKNRYVKQSDLARALGISASRVSNYISGKREPDITLLAKIAKYLSVDLNYFTDVKFEKRATPAVSGAKIVALPYKTANSNKTHHYVPVAERFVEGVSYPKRNSELCEIVDNVGGTYFKNSDILLMAKKNAAPLKHGSFLFKTGKKCKMYRYVRDKKKETLVSLNSLEVLPLSHVKDIDKYKVVLWVFSKPH